MKLKCTELLEGNLEKKPKSKIGGLVRTSNFRKTFFNGDTTKWSYDLQTKKI